MRRFAPWPSRPKLVVCPFQALLASGVGRVPIKAPARRRTRAQSQLSTALLSRPAPSHRRIPALATGRPSHPTYTLFLTPYRLLEPPLPPLSFLFYAPFVCHHVAIEVAIEPTLPSPRLTGRLPRTPTYRSMILRPNFLSLFCESEAVPPDNSVRSHALDTWQGRYSSVESVLATSPERSVPHAEEPVPTPS